MAGNVNPNRRDFVKSSAIAGATLAMPQIALSDDGKPAVLGGTPTRTKEYPEWPLIDDTDRAKFKDALERRAWCRLYDDITTEFETAWAKNLGAKHCIGVVNGTNALYAALNAVGVEPGDEVIVPPYTFVATVNAVIQQYALPVFADTDVETFQIDAGSVEAKVNANTKCVLPVHFGGSVVDMDALGAVAKKHNLAVIEDTCQSHFAQWNGKCAGTLSDVGCFSHQSTKILPCGEGGTVTTNDDAVYDRLHAFQNNGRDRVTGTRNGYIHQGTNLRMTEYQAALLLAQLERLDAQCTLRAQNADYLTSLLDGIPGIEPARMYDGCTRNTYYLYMLRYVQDEFKGLPKEKFLNALRKEGISAGNGYGPLNKEPFLKTMFESRGYKRLISEKRMKEYWEQNECPQNEILCKQGIFMYQEFLLGAKEDMDLVAKAIWKIYNHADAVAKA